MRKYSQFVLVEPNNCPPFVDNVTSDSPIDINRVWDVLSVNYDLNQDKDSITFVDAPTLVDLDA